MICVSTGRDFISAAETNKNVEIKAKWSRVRKEEGFGATLINVNSNLNPNVNVDPFEKPRSNKKNQFLSIKKSDQNDEYQSSSTDSLNPPLI